MPNGEIQKLIITEEVIRIKSYFPLKTVSFVYVSVMWSGKKNKAESFAKYNFIDRLLKWMYI